MRFPASFTRLTSSPVRDRGKGAPFVLSIAVVLLLGTVASSLAQGLEWTPAKFIRELDPPGSGNRFDRPGCIYYDARYDEVYVADHGNGRVVIFDGSGVFRHEFHLGDHCGVPLDLAVNSEGLIYVLGTTRNGERILVFDFDGLYLRSLDLAPMFGGRPHDISQLALDREDNLYLLDQRGLQIVVVAGEERLVGRVPLFPEGEAERYQGRAVFGSFAIHGDRIYLPVSSLGTVYIYRLDGEFVRTIGHFGDGLAQLSFPVSVGVASNGIILVLDKHRFVAVAFNQDGRPLGEFGGKGFGPGWFYHPTWLAVDGRDQIYVGQVFDNRVQVCALTESILRRFEELAIGTSSGATRLAALDTDPPGRAEEEVAGSN